MDLSTYVMAVRQGLTSAAELADDHTQEVAGRLGVAIDSSVRLALLTALSDAAATISAELAPTSVDVRVAGGDPEFIVRVPAASAQPTLLLPPDEADAADEGDPEDEPVARISLRLPSSVKTRVDEVADRDGISTNAWLIRAIVDALADRRGRGDRRTGGPLPPAPPVPPIPGVSFDFDFPFGTVRAGSGPRHRDRGADRHPGPGGPAGGVQGWVR